MPEWMNSPDVEGASPSTPKPLASWYAQGLSDGLGDRLLMFDNSDAPSLELLRFRPDLADVPGFEAALRERVHRLDRFRHPAFARVRSVQRLEPDDDLALISNCTPGKRLSEVLHHARGPAFAAALIHQLAPALVLLQQQDDGISHGVLTPDRIVVSPDGHLTIVEHVVGPAIDTLNLRPAQLAAMGIPLPPAAGDAAAPLDVATDWYQLGLVAISVLLGRQVTASELPQLETLLDRVGHSAGRDGTVLSPWIRQWLDRALQISSARIESGEEARAALDELLQKEQPRSARQLESLYDEQPAPLGPSRTNPTERVADLIIDVADASPVVVAAAPDEPPQSLPYVQSPANAVTPADFRLDIEPQMAASPAAVTDLKPERAGHREEAPVIADTRKQEPIAAKVRHIDSGRAAVHHKPRAAARSPRDDRQAATRPRVPDPHPLVPPQVQHAAPVGFPLSVVAALMLIAAVEAGVIAWLATPLWLSPAPVLAVETATSGEKVVVNKQSSSEVPPLRLTVAPDMRWVSVTSPSLVGVIGGTAANTQAGTIRISSPIALKVFEKSRLLGSVPGPDLKVPAGRHDIELVNAALGYRLEQSFEVEAGQTMSVHVAPPFGSLTVYSVPPSEVSIDGQVVGTTPLGPMPIALGAHSVTFRHSSGLKDRQRVMIKAGETVRVIGNIRR